MSVESPQGICFRSGANMWIANAGNNSVTKMVANGNGNILGTLFRWETAPSD